jgi:MFS family permease
VASLAVAVALFTRWGITGTLSRDESIYAYGGQRLAHGLPPYASIFDPKGPGATMIAGLGAGIARLVGDNQLAAIRFGFFLCSCLTVLAIYLLAARLWNSVVAGLVAAIVLASFNGFAADALSGPDAKTPGVLAFVLSMWLLLRRQWFLAAIAGSVAFLVWQPLIIFPVMAVVVAACNSPARERLKAAGFAAAGAVLPVAAVIIYFAAAGALRIFFESAFEFPATGIVRPKETVGDRLHRIATVVREYYHVSGVLFWIGLVLLVLLVLVHLAQGRSNLRQALRDPLVLVVLVTALGVAGYACFDFQGYPDVLPLLPYPALGLAGAAAAVLRLLRRSSIRLVATAGALVGLSVLTAFSWVWFTEDPTNDNGLRAQRADACAVERMLGPDGRLQALGDPVALVMTDRRNPDNYIYLTSGVDLWKVSHTPGGFDGWTAQIHAADPAVVTLGGNWHNELRDRMQGWLLSDGYRMHYVGSWHILITSAARARAQLQGVTLTARPTLFATGAAGHELPASGCG